MDKLLENLCENLQKNQSFFADPPFLKQLFYLNQSSLNVTIMYRHSKNILVFRLEKVFLY